MEVVRVVHPDTDVTPYDMGTLGSRSLYHMGLAVKRAAEDARDKLAALAGEVGLSAETTPVPGSLQEEVRHAGGKRRGRGKLRPVVQIAGSRHGAVAGRDAVLDGRRGGRGVEVDTETGRVTVTKLVNVADVGTPINPRIVETQLSGGAIMQLGFTMTEKMEFELGPGDESVARRLPDPGHARYTGCPS